VLLFIAVTIVLGIFYSPSSSNNSLLFFGDAILELMFPLSVILYFRLYKKAGRDVIISNLGIGKKNLSLYFIALGLVLFFIITIIGIGIGLISNITGTSISTNVSVAFAGAPLWFYIFAALVAPVCEEILFRGFMVPRIGIVASAVIFGLLHFSYNSTFGIEIIAAMIFGLLAGYLFKRTGSLYPSILAHILVNTLAVVMLLK
jgi:hypothetical protein